MYRPMECFLQQSEVRKLSPLLVMSKFINESWFSVSFSIVNFILGCAVVVDFAVVLIIREGQRQRVLRSMKDKNIFTKFCILKAASVPFFIPSFNF